MGSEQNRPRENVKFSLQWAAEWRKFEASRDKVEQGERHSRAGKRSGTAGDALLRIDLPKCVQVQCHCGVDVRSSRKPVGPDLGVLQCCMNKVVGGDDSR